MFALRIAVSLLTTASLVLAGGPAPVIGIAKADGSFRLNGAQVTGNGTLFDGELVQTGVASSDLHLKGGAGIALAADSAGKVFADHLVLQQGSSQLRTSGAYRIEAGGFRVLPGRGGQDVYVALKGSSSVQVGVLTGSAQVFQSSGALLANVTAGTTLMFDPPQESTSIRLVTLKGKVVSENGHYYLLDDTTQLKFEIVGKDLANLAGKVVAVTGEQVTAATATTVGVVTVTTAAIVATAGLSTAAAGTALGSHSIIAGIGIAAASAGVAVGVVKATDSSSSLSK